MYGTIYVSMTDVLSPHEVDSADEKIAVGADKTAEEPSFSEEDRMFIACARRIADKINSRRTCDQNVGWGTDVTTERIQNE